MRTRKPIPSVEELLKRKSLTVREAEVAFGIGRKNLEKLMRDEKIKFFMLGAQIRINTLSAIRWELESSGGEALASNGLRPDSVDALIDLCDVLEKAAVEARAILKRLKGAS